MELAYLTGDLKGDAARDPDATLPLLARGACATLGILGFRDSILFVEFKSYGRICWRFYQEVPSVDAK